MTKWRFVAQRVIFLAFLLGLFFALNAITVDRQKVTATWATVQQEGSTSDVLFLGSSYTYTSIDAGFLSQALGKDIYVLGTPSQNIHITNENLRVLLKTHHPKIIVLDIGTVLMSRNEDLINEDKKNLIYNDIDGMYSVWDRLRASSRFLDTADLFEGTFQLLRSVKMWDRFSPSYWKESLIIYETSKNRRGSFLQASIAKTDSADLIEQKASNYRAWYAMGPGSLSSDREEQLREFLQITQEHGIEVWLYRAPSTTLTEEYVGGMARIRAIGEEYGVTNFDCLALDMDKIGITADDFYDPGHLNRNGAVKISNYYGPLIGERLQVAYDPTRAFAYAGESVQEQKDGSYLYAMTNTQPGTQYRFTLKHKKKVLLAGRFSQNNTFYCTVDVRTEPNYDLQVEMIPPDIDPADAQAVSDGALTFSLMKQNEAVLE